MTLSTRDPRMELFLQNLQRAFDERSWHGPNLMGSIRGMKPDEAAWRPQPARHNAWEYIVHAAYWKYRIIRLLDDKFAGSFSQPGSNFFERPVELTGAALQQDVALLKDWHTRLLRTVEAVPIAALGDTPGRGEFTKEALIYGAAAHDVYHAGQIRLLRRMFGGRGEAGH